ncbi:transposable element Tcb1 transposase [Trichonephila clavipes]|nr:transposable element Tcb1 transposase [Trichonephila clavipes]
MDCAHGSDGSCKHIMIHITTDSICYTTFGVRSFHSTPFSAEWNVHKSSIAGVCTANGAMNGGHGHRNKTILYLQSSTAFACYITMVGLEFGDSVIELLPWPACSPDLSPSEYVWSMLAQRLALHTTPTAIPDQFRQYAKAAWITVSQGYIQSLFDSVSRIVAEVIANNGSYTNY